MHGIDIGNITGVYWESQSLSWCLGIDIGNITGVYWESIDIKNGDYGIDSSNITIVY